MKTYLNWSFCHATIACRKLPQNWESQGKFMVYRIAYLVKAYDIPPTLIVNTRYLSYSLIFYFKINNIDPFRPKNLVCSHVTISRTLNMPWLMWRPLFFVFFENFEHNIICNGCCIGIHLVSMAREHTWKIKGLKDVKVIRMEDKQQVIVCVLLAIDGYLLPFQIILTGKTNWCLSKSASTKDCLFSLPNGFHFSMIEND